MTVEVIIVSYNSGNVLPRCLDALRGQTAQHSIQIIDNASQDGSILDIHRRYPDVNILPLRRNTGFARAVNIAAGRSSADVIVTLNPDTVPAPSFIEEIIRPFDTGPKIASVAGTLLFESRPEIIASAGIAMHANGVAIDDRLGDRFDPTLPVVPVFGASGGAAAFRRNLFLETGGFAEPFFMYLEDVDLAWRLRLQGYESVWNPAATVLHNYSASAGEGSDFKRRLLARNRIWTLVRSLPDEAWARHACSILAFDTLAFGFSVATLDVAAASGRALGVAGLLPRLIERKRIQQTRTTDWPDLERWVRPSISPFRLRELRQLTGQLASSLE